MHSFESTRKSAVIFFGLLACAYGVIGASLALNFRNFYPSGDRFRFGGAVPTLEKYLESHPGVEPVQLTARDRQEAQKKGYLNAKVFKQKDGGTEFVLYPGDINYVDDRGNVVEADPQFRPQSDGTFLMDKASYTARAPAFADETLTVTIDEENVTFTALGIDGVPVAHQAGVVARNRVVYADAFGPGIDYVVEAEADELRKLVVFRTPQTPARNVRIEFATSLPQTTVIHGRNTTLGKIFFRQPSIWDSNNHIEPITIALKDGKLTKVIPRSFFVRGDGVALTYPVTTDSTGSYYAMSGDGTVGYGCLGGGCTWASAHDASPGSSVNSGGGSVTMGINVADSGTNLNIQRAYIPLNTSALTSDGYLSKAILYVWVYNKNQSLSDVYTVGVVYTNQASSHELSTWDYNTVSTSIGETKNINTGSNLLTNNAYNAFLLNASGRTKIAAATSTRLGLREGHDLTDTSPGTSNGNNLVTWYTSKYTGTANDPYLWVAKATASISSVTTERSVYATSSSNITITATMTTDEDIATTTIGYVIYLDRNQDGDPDTGEKYITSNCAGSASWVAGNYTKATTNFKIDSTASPKTDTVTCSNANFPENGNYNIYVNWYDDVGVSIATNTSGSVQSCNQPTGIANWWDPDMLNRVILQFRSSTFNEALFDFPVLVKATATNQVLDDIDSSGDDVRFIDENNGTMLNYEKEYVDSTTTHEAYWWVRVPKIATSTDCDYITMYYDNTSTSTAATTTGVWRDDYYEAVWHFGESASGTMATLAAGGTNAFATTTFNAAGLSVIQSWIDGSNSNEGMYIGPWDNTETDGEVWNSSENATTAQRPKFTVDCSGGTTYKFRDGEASYAGTTDTYHDQNAPTNNYGVATSLYADESGTGTNDQHSFMKFDLSSIPTNCVATAAYLTIYTTNPMGTAGLNFDILEMKQAWVEGSGNGSATGDGVTWTTYDGTNTWNTAGGEGINTDVAIGVYLDSTQFHHDEVNSTLASRSEKNQSIFGYSPKMGGAAGSGIGVPDSAGFDITNQTITGWFKRIGTGDPATFSLSQTIEPFVSKGMGEADTQIADIQFAVGYNRSGQATLGANFEDDRHITGNDWSFLGGSTVANGAWRHFGYRLKDHAIANLYLDGFANNTTTYPVNQGASTGGTMKLGIGTAYKTDATTDGGWFGYLDEIRVYKVAVPTSTASTTQSVWLRAEWYAADNGYVEWLQEATSTNPNPIEQVHYRWRNDDGSEVNATWGANEDTATTTNFGGIKRLRISVNNNNGGSKSNTFMLQYGTSANPQSDAGWMTVPSSTACATTSPIIIKGSTNLTDGTATTNVESGVSDPNTTFVAGDQKDGNATTTSITLAGTEFTEIEFAIQLTQKASNDATYYFRLATTSGNGVAHPLDTYNVTPALSVDDFSATYVADDCDGQAWEGDALSGAFNDGGEVEFTAADYTAVSVDNSSYVQDDTSAPYSDTNYEYHRFTFPISQPVGDITSITVTWKGVNGGGAAPSFVPDTAVQTSEGNVAMAHLYDLYQRHIEGMPLVTYLRQNRTYPGHVTAAVQHPYDGEIIVLELANGHTVHVTPYHQLLVDGANDSYVDAGAIAVGDDLVGEQGAAIAVKNIYRYGLCGLVYDLTIQEFHNYLLSAGIFVHNTYPIGSYGQSLWVKESGTWTQKDSGTSGSKETLTVTYTSDIANLISNGIMNVAAQSTVAEHSGSVQSTVNSYYIEVIVSTLSNPIISSAYDQTFTVGQSKATSSAITITNGSAGVITAADDIRIKIPSSFNMIWDSHSTICTIAPTLSEYTSEYFTNDLPTITADLSGVTYSSTTDSLFMIINGTPTIYEFTLGGSYVRTITMHGFIDTESIDWMYGNMFVVTEERDPYDIIYFPLDQSTTTLGLSEGTIIDPTITCVSNACIEGITYDVENNWFYVETEKQADGSNGGRVFKVTMDGTVTELTTLNTALLNAGYTDLADIAYDPVTHDLFLLSQEQETIIEATSTGTILGTFSVSGFFQPEGLDFSPNGDYMFVTGEDDEYGRYARDSKINNACWFEDGDKTLVLDVTSDFDASESRTIGLMSFKNFTAVSAADNLELEVYNDDATNAYDDKTIEIESGAALSVTASSSILSFPPVSYSFSAQTTTVANPAQGSVYVAGGAGSWTLNINCSANSEDCYWNGPAARSYSFQDGVYPTAGYDGTQDLNIASAEATTNQD
ncbi:MAG: DUF2341 domain-containing protein, partial [Patescibacteria group bacterium]|nr:DUF2341 domain-containing protein [Patescibacteria group bacterium]